MKKPKTVIILAGLVLLLPLTRTYSQGALELLASTNSETRLNAAIQLDEQRRQLIKQLMAILDSTNSDESKMDAAVVLSNYRAYEAVPFLVNHLEWEINMQRVETLHPTRSRGLPPTLRLTTENDEAYATALFPVTSALWKIGLPAIPALLDKITQTDDAGICRICALICGRIESQEVTQFRLQGLLDKETDQKKKDRIQSALDVLKELNSQVNSLK